MAKWKRGGGQRGRWMCETLPRQENGQWAMGKRQTSEEEPDPFSFDTAEAILAALARLEVRRLVEKCAIVDG